MMNPSHREPSDEQRRVIQAEHDKFVVTAAAGAGKTYVLVERYLRHVTEEGLTPDQILTITFTRKAAAEMKERIVRRLRTVGRFDEAQIAETGPIQTFHSFCERLLRENAFEAGLDPQFSILNDAQADKIRTEAILDAIARASEESPAAEGLIRLLTGRPARLQLSPYAHLRGAVESVLAELRGSGNDLEVLEKQHASVETLKPVWDQAIAEAMPQELRERLIFAEGESPTERMKNVYRAADIKFPPWLKSTPDATIEEEALEHACGLVQLACSAWHRMERAIDARQQLDFVALETRAKQLLEKSQVTVDRIKDQYRVVMVDEAQDLNPIQYQLLELLGIGRQMLVGDRQQSIYGFRQADVSLFERHLASSESLKLTKNYRSGEGILSFVDLLYSRLWTAEYERMNRPEDPLDLETVVSVDCTGVEIWEQSPDGQQESASFVRELIEEGVPERDIFVLVRDATFAGKLKTKLAEAGVAAEIVGGRERFYTRLEVRDMANVLRAVADPYDDFSLLACLRSPVVGLSLDSIILLGREPRIIDHLEAFEAATARDQEILAKFRSWYDPLREKGDRLSAWEIIAEVFARSNYLLALARRPHRDQIIANVRKLLTLAIDEPEFGPLQFAERIREIQDIVHKEGEAPIVDDESQAVRLMTIHKAKGLEFPVVVIPQTDRDMTSRKKEVVVEPRKGLVATNFSKGESQMLRFLNAGRRIREEAEELRVLYVAMTRARHRLCIAKTPVGPKRTISSVIEKSIGKQMPPGVRIRTREPRQEQAEPT
jgi:ATP-dependent exoDNAse (exonuclease V) beta subunit